MDLVDLQSQGSVQNLKEIQYLVQYKIVYFG